MNGTWKENISGYERKGTKRRKQTRKHLLKDKAKIFIRKFHYNDIENEVFHNEANNCTTEPTEPTYESHGFVEVYNVSVVRHHYKKPVDDYLIPIYSESVRTAYSFDGNYYDVYDGLQIIGDEFTKLDFLEYVEVDYPYRIEINKVYRQRRVGFEDELFIYGKPIPEDWHHTFGFCANKGRKYAQKKANSMDRQRVRDYLAIEDWNTDVRTHVLSKSIAWEIW